MKKILMILIVLAGIGGGAFAGLMLKPAPGGGGEDAGAAAEGGAAGDGGDGHAGGEGEAGGDAGHGGGDAHGDAGSGDAEGHGEAGGHGEGGADGDGARDYVEIGKQMIIPVVSGEETQALMMFELALDVPVTMRDTVFMHEPRIRDAFLRVLFAMSHTGAFLDTFTDDLIVEELRQKLLAAARSELGPDVGDVLILDIMRQEM